MDIRGYTAAVQLGMQPNPNCNWTVGCASLGVVSERAATRTTAGSRLGNQTPNLLVRLTYVAQPLNLSLAKSSLFKREA